jgi:Bacterial membrane protein YfhO
MAASYRSTIAALVLLFALALAIFADLLFGGGARVLGHSASDLFLQYYAWRDFGFRELAKGNLALWNPHIFSGAPYLGGMQGAQLYPPNWIFLILPLPVAINWSIALHVFAIAAFMFLWMKQRGLAASASFLAGTLVMFSGAFFTHIFAGHLPQLCTMSWAPLIFCSIDTLLRTRRVIWLLVGIFGVAMQILAGFPQYLYYTAIIATLYTTLRLLSDWNWRVALAFIAIYIGGALLASVQLLPAIQTTHETTRGLRLPFNFASMVAFPPENSVTLLAPNFFGEIAKYWGRWYLWETSLFIGVSGLVLAIYAAIRCDLRVKLPALLIILVSLLLASGVYTPLFHFLYVWVPGFDRFRSVSKFIFPASLFIILLAATGFDQLLRAKTVGRVFVAAVFAGAVVLGLVAWWVGSTASWPALMNTARVSGESYLVPQLYSKTEFISRSQQCATTSLGIAAAVCALLGAILLAARYNARALFGVIPLAVAEMLVFASNARPASDSSMIVNAEEKNFLAEHPGDYRIMNVNNPNTAMIIGGQDLWGYDANVIRRYAEFMTWTQGGDPSNAMSYVKLVQFSPLFAMLRERYVFAEQNGKVEMAESPVVGMPHLQLISNYRVLQNRSAIFEAMRSETFDPTREVILESEPDPKPVQSNNNGTARITATTTDSLTIEADVEQPSILIITDGYAASWRTVSMPGSSQAHYDLLPANYVLRAVPLAAGHHLFRVEYRPVTFVIGKWISLICLAAFFAGLIRCIRASPSF